MRILLPLQRLLQVLWAHYERVPCGNWLEVGVLLPSARRNAAVVRRTSSLVAGRVHLLWQELVHVFVRLGVDRDGCAARVDRERRRVIVVPHPGQGLSLPRGPHIWQRTRPLAPQRVTSPVARHEEIRRVEARVVASRVGRITLREHLRFLISRDLQGALA